MESAENTSADMSAGPPTTAADDGPTEYCDIIDQDVSRGDCERYRQAKARLARGVAAFSVPGTMKRGETAVVELALARGADQEAVSEMVASEGRETEPISEVRVARYMAAELDGEGFTVAPAGVQRKDLFLSGSARWRWEITALKAKKHELALTVYAEIGGPDGQPKPQWTEVARRTVTVETTWGQTFGDGIEAAIAWLGRIENLLTALAAVLVALGIVIWRWKTLGGKPEAGGGG